MTEPLPPFNDTKARWQSLLLIPMLIGGLALMVMSRLAPMFFIVAIVAGMSRHGLDFRAIASNPAFWIAGAWCIVGTLLWRLKFKPSLDKEPEIDIDVLIKFAEGADARRYLYVIIQQLAADPRTKIVLRRSQSLPVLKGHDPGKIPSFAQVRSYLVLMASVENKLFANVGLQLIQLRIKDKPFHLWLKFYDDLGEPAVELRVERPPPMQPPQSSQGPSPQ